MCPSFNEDAKSDVAQPFYKLFARDLDQVFRPDLYKPPNLAPSVQASIANDSTGWPFSSIRHQRQ